MKVIQATLILVLAWGLAPFPLSAQPTETQPAETETEEFPGFGNRFDAFLFLWANPLSNDRQVTLRSLDELRKQQPSEFSAWTLVLLGNGPSPDQLGIDASTFVRSGGSLLVGTDRAMTLSLGRPPRFNIKAGPIQASLDSSIYQGRLSCPLVTEFRRSHELLAGIQRIALNLPGFFAQDQSEAWGIAYLPVASNVDRRWRVWLTAGDLGQGRFVASADQSVFSNEMIQEADNVRLADNTVRWLLEKKPASSNLVCLVEGRELTRLVDERFVTGDWQKRPPTSEILNELLRGLQEEDVPNAIAREAQASISSFHPWIVRQIGMIVLGSVMGALLAWRILGAREASSPMTLPSHSDGWVPGFDRPSIAGLPRADRILDARQKEMATSDNYRPQLGRETRLALDRWFGIDGWRGGMPNPTLRQPTWWNRRRARLRLRTLDRLAQGDSAEAVSERKFRYWQSEIQRLDSMMRGTSDLRPQENKSTTES